MDAKTAARIAALKNRPTNQAHGSRARYMKGCRCLRCRAANARYETGHALERRKGRGNGCVSTSRVRQHLTTLSRQGVGYKRVAKVARVKAGILLEVRLGRRKHMRAQAADRVLGVSAAGRAQAATVGAAEVAPISWTG